MGRVPREGAGWELAPAGVYLRHYPVKQATEGNGLRTVRASCVRGRVDLDSC